MSSTCPADELLHTAAGDIHDVHGTVRGHGNVVRQSELPVVVAEPAEALEHTTIGPENYHAGPVRRRIGLIPAVDDEDRRGPPRSHTGARAQGPSTP